MSDRHRDFGWDLDDTPADDPDVFSDEDDDSDDLEYCDDCGVCCEPEDMISGLCLSCYDAAVSEDDGDVDDDEDDEC